MHPEIENLINMALADGEITEKEREIIFRKAEKLGEDKDEAEMILDGKIALMKKEKADTPQAVPKSNKEGDIKKCPACGATVPSFQTKCSDCGHEFRNATASSSVERLYSELQKIEETERSRERSWSQKLDGGLGIQRSVITRQISALTAFPIPNAKEDILEFLSIGSSEASKKATWFMGIGQHPEYLLKKAWLSKCQQIIMKARFSMKDDKKTLEEVERYAKELGIK
jgi:hypothetical protein